MPSGTTNFGWPYVADNEADKPQAVNDALDAADASLKGVADDLSTLTGSLGDSATKDVGTGAGEVAAGDHTHSALTQDVVIDGVTLSIVNGIIQSVSP